MLVVSGQIAIPPETQVIPRVVRRYLALQLLGWSDVCRLIVALFESHRLFHMWDISLHPVYRTVVNLPEDERCLARVIDEIFKCYAAQKFPKATMWGDQSPINTFYWPWIYRTFPHARFLHLLRDGRDAIASLVERGLSLEDATNRWIGSVEQCRALQNYVAAGQYLEVRYEALVSKPTETLQRICMFVGVEYDARMLDFWKSPTTIEHRYQDYHRNLGRSIFTDSIGSWKERLSPEQQEYVLAKTVDWLEYLGYVDQRRPVH